MRRSFAQALSLLQRVIDLEQEANCDTTVLVMLYLQLAQTNSLAEQPLEAEQSYRKALMICRERLTNWSIHAHTLLYLFTHLCFYQRFEDANQIGQELLEVDHGHELLGLQTHTFLLMQVGQINQLLNLKAVANSYFQRAIIGFDELMGEGNGYSQALRRACIQNSFASPADLNALLNQSPTDDSSH
jgi:tetratricopeptide (TPR) repeat protein